jgi:hypothetical protein
VQRGGRFPKEKLYENLVGGSKRQIKRLLMDDPTKKKGGERVK